MADLDAILKREMKIKSLTEHYREDTGATPLWAFLFGPLYFAVFGFWGRAVVTFILCLFIVGFLVSPFIARKGWINRAEAKAREALDSGVVA